MNKCENCKDPDGCPWLPGENGVKKCQVWTERKSEERILKMVLKAGRKIDRCHRFEDLNYSKFKTKDDIKIFKAGIKSIQTIHTNINHLFFIFSKPGTGKTHCLLSYAFKMICLGVNVWYTTASRMRDVWLDEMRRWEIDDYDHREARNIYESEILLVDDFCHEGVSLAGHFQRHLEGILTSTAKKVILASNLNKTDEKFPYKNEDWIMDRLNQAVEIAWFGESYRQSKR